VICCIKNIPKYKTSDNLHFCEIPKIILKVVNSYVVTIKELKTGKLELTVSVSRYVEQYEVGDQSTG